MPRSVYIYIRMNSWLCNNRHTKCTTTSREYIEMQRYLCSHLRYTEVPLKLMEIERSPYTDTLLMSRCRHLPLYLLFINLLSYVCTSSIPFTLVVLSTIAPSISSSPGDHHAHHPSIAATCSFPSPSLPQWVRQPQHQLLSWRFHF